MWKKGSGDEATVENLLALLRPQEKFSSIVYRIDTECFVEVPLVNIIKSLIFGISFFFEMNTSFEAGVLFSGNSAFSRVKVW